MIKNVLLTVALLVALWFSGRVSVSLWHYWRLPASASAEVYKVKVCQRSDSVYKLKIYYTFFSGKVRGKTMLGKPYYLNRFAAEKAAENLQKSSLQVHYNPKDPLRSSLERTFPYKDFLYALMACGILCYFFVLLRQTETSSSSLAKNSR